MRRGTRHRLVLVAVAALAVTACTGGGSASDLVEPSAEQSESSASSDVPTATSADDVTDAQPSGDESADPLAGDGFVELPGLLDPTDEAVPNDDGVRTGTLPNGLRYYVRHNERPGSKASLRLAIRAGSVNETGANTGVAHFVEHMLFNGTERFPENELIDVLRGFGADFGADINAYTSYDETVYQLDVPNDDESLEVGMSILEQWLSHATFDPEQVDAERGVVLDEWRGSTQDVSGRLFDVAQGLYLDGSPYEGRDPIGTEASISTVSRDELKQYYDDWYRPDNAAVVVVGDIDVDDMVATIETLFGPATARTPAMPERPDTTFAIETEPAFALHSDPDQTTVDVEVDLPLPAFDSKGTAGLRAFMIDYIVFDALVRRLQLDVNAGTASFDDIVPGGNSIVPSLDAPALYAFTDAERVDATLAALLDEFHRAARFGFTQQELDVARADVQAALDAEYAGRDTVQDVDYADVYVEHFLSDGPYPDADVNYELGTAELQAITTEALDLRFRARFSNSAPHVIISTPQSDESAMPTEADVLAAIAAAADRQLEPRDAGRDLPSVLMTAPDPADETSRDTMFPGGDEFFDPVRVTYPNGVTVIATSNDIVAGRLWIDATSPGGLSLVADDDVIDAGYAASVVGSSGIADLNQVELAQVLAGADVSVFPEIHPYVERFSGEAATPDLEVALQLINLYMTRPRFDPVALEQLVASEGPLVDDPGADPDTAVYDRLVELRYAGEPRYDYLPTPEQFATLDLAGIERVWQQRFGNASDWVFVFAGDFDKDELFELTARYLGTLPGTGVVEEWVDVAPDAPAGVVRETVTAGTGETSSAVLSFTSPVPDIDGRLRAEIDVTTEVITARLTSVIREQLGDSYSPTAYSYFTTDPDPVVETYVSITGAPDRIEAVTDVVIAEFADLAANGPSATEFDGALALVEERYNFVNNVQFVTELSQDAIWPGLEIDDWFESYAALFEITADDVRQFVATHIPADRYVSVAALPR